MEASNNVSVRICQIPNISCQAPFLLDFELTCAPKAVLFQWLISLTPSLREAVTHGQERDSPGFVREGCREPGTGRTLRVTKGLGAQKSGTCTLRRGAGALQGHATGSAVHWLGSQGNFPFLTEPALFVPGTSLSSVGTGTLSVLARYLSESCGASLSKCSLNACLNE